jgi:hypothetical protein
MLDYSFFGRMRKMALIIRRYLPNYLYVKGRQFKWERNGDWTHKWKGLEGNIGGRKEEDKNSEI